jgi:hypothetical protein
LVIGAIALLVRMTFNEMNQHETENKVQMIRVEGGRIVRANVVVSDL